MRHIYSLVCCLALLLTVGLASPAYAAGDNIPILFYHRVAVPTGTFLHNGMTVTPTHFDQQMAYLSAHGYHTISFAQWYAHLKIGAPLPPKPIIITFDDGYEDVYTNAVPILQKYGFTATIFVVTGDVGGTNVWDRAKGYDSAPLLTWDELKTLANAGFDIEPHTVTHPHLTRLSPAQAEQEIRDAKATLEARLGRQVDTFCYPYGDYNNEIQNIVRGSGFTGAVTTKFGYAHGRRNLFALHRINITRFDTVHDLADKLEMAKTL